MLRSCYQEDRVKIPDHESLNWLSKIDFSIETIILFVLGEKQPLKVGGNPTFELEYADYNRGSSDPIFSREDPEMGQAP